MNFDLKELQCVISKDGKNSVAQAPVLVAADLSSAFIVKEWANEDDQNDLTPKILIPINPAFLQEMHYETTGADYLYTQPVDSDSEIEFRGHRLRSKFSFSIDPGPPGDE